MLLKSKLSEKRSSEATLNALYREITSEEHLKNKDNDYEPNGQKMNKKEPEQESSSHLQDDSYRKKQEESNLKNQERDLLKDDSIVREILDENQQSFFRIDENQNDQLNGASV